MIVGDKVELRKVRLSDASIIMVWENDTRNWGVSDTDKAYHFEDILNLIVSSRDFSETNQLRMIVLHINDNIPLGSIDLFEYDEKENSVHLGILIAEEEHRKKGYAKESINLIKGYVRDYLKIDILKCRIQPKNISSAKLFKSCGFEFVKQEFQSSKNTHVDLLQICLRK
ncbi:MAG: diamine N-acetyltransferase [Psychromonas sp.]